MTSQDLPPITPEPVVPGMTSGAAFPPAPEGSAPTGYWGAPPVTPGWDQPPSGPAGRVRSTGLSILLYVVTLGIYGWVWWYQTHEEMKRHTGQGIGGAVALILAVFVPVVNAFLTPAEVANLYERRGQHPPVSAITGLWSAIGWIILVGPIVWFVKTNNALNDYWRSLGAPG
ncbi:DUF4234 domain-containing protein [Intrasporangium sp.]|uniref:DUF4234 domain-containing protein n=1 Tax=Intrasporangium sp. TaxID=1925024 RepID=UPI003221A3A8